MLGQIGASWEYRYKFLILVVSQPAMALTAHFLLGAPGEWYAPRFDPLIGSLAAGLATVGMLIRVWGTTALSDDIMASTNPDTDHIVMTGPYALTRNPLYLGTIVQFTGYGLFFGWLPAALFGAFHWFRYDRVVKFEERNFGSRWGEQFDTYLSTVPRWSLRMRALGSVGGPFVSTKSLLSNALFVSIAAGCVVSAALNSLIWIIPIETVGGLITAVYFVVNQRSEGTVVHPLPVEAVEERTAA